MTLEDLIRRFERDRALHTTSGPSDEEELRRTEAALGCALPGGFRAFLARLGGGIYYGRHEIFGGHPVMIHDIELVPSLRGVALDPAARSAPPGPVRVPFHRAEGVLHLLETSGREPAVSSWPPGCVHPSFEAFLESLLP